MSITENTAESRTRSIRGRENYLDCNLLAQRTHKVHEEPSSSDDDQTTRHHRRSTVAANCTRARHRRQAAPPKRNSIKATALPQAFAAMSAPSKRNFVKATAPPQAFAATHAPHHLLQDCQTPSPPRPVAIISKAGRCVEGST
ncbi:hypothetical protein KSP39_PZI006232 [Platanthera zijinensis]|uniref:Uncharacterized protein n=1 Tax=Platanthera zijinensis TaxID=2320716 RepID=A0AAP0BTG7_9ASPA